MLKTVFPESYNFDQPAVQEVPLSRRGLVGEDRARFIKRASDRIAHKISKLKFEPGEVPIHLLALGATEYYGPNRNGDGFKVATCRECHPSFEKLAKWYRHHKSRGNHPHYGTVKLATYNDKMHRIELVVGLYGTKQAAKRGGGEVADKELEKLASDKPVAVSMGCSIDYDVCSGCGNKAKSTREYCTEDTCKYGGLKRNIGKVFDDGHLLHADNVRPRFFDISHVFRPADRIAYVLGRLDNDKTAAFQKAAEEASPGIGGAALAEMVGLKEPWRAKYADRYLLPSVRAQLEALEKLAAEEEVPHEPTVLDLAVSDIVTTARPVPIKLATQHEFSSFLRALAQENCLLPLAQFAEITGNKFAGDLSEVLPAVRAALPGAFSRLAERPNIRDILADNPYYSTTAPAQEHKIWALERKTAWSLDRPHVVNRTQLATVRGVAPTNVRVKRAAVITPAAQALADEYAKYQVAFLATQPDTADHTLTCQLILRHNYL